MGHQFANSSLSITTLKYLDNWLDSFLTKWAGNKFTNAHEKDDTKIHESSTTQLLCDLK